MEQLPKLKFFSDTYEIVSFLRLAYDEYLLIQYLFAIFQFIVSVGWKMILHFSASAFRLSLEKGCMEFSEKFNVVLKVCKEAYCSFYHLRKYSSEIFVYNKQQNSLNVFVAFEISEKASGEYPAKQFVLSVTCK